MPFIRHVCVLTQKNFQIIKRSKLWFLIEILFALLLLPIFSIVVYKSSSEVSPSRYYAPVNITGDYEDVRRVVESIIRISSKMCNAEKKLAFASVNDIGDQLMKDFESRYKQPRLSIIVERFPTVDDMKAALFLDVNATANKVCGRYMGGIYISQLSFDPPKFTYRIFIRERNNFDWYTERFWPDDGPYGALSDLNSIPSRPPYWSSGFLSFQYALDSLFLKSINKVPMNVQLARFPTPKFRNNGLLAILKAMPILFILLVIVVMMHTTKEIVAEKENGIRTHLMVGGMQSITFYASHFITSLLKIFLVMGSSAIVLSLGFDSIDSMVFITFCLLFGITAVLFSVLISVLFRRTSFAVAAVLFLWFGCFALDNHLKISPTRIGLCVMGSLNPFTAFHLGLLAMSSYESRLIRLSWLNIFAESTTSFSVGLAFLMLLIDSVLMCLFIYYFDAVWPTDDSPKRNPLFFLPCLSSKFEHSLKVMTDNENDTSTDKMEDIRERSVGRDEADISIRHMRKIWSTGQVAVDNLSFDAYRGQVTVLLGHNGAGKSTTFSVISGICAATQGDVYICKQSIKNNLADCQRNIGFCPQYNPLFERLTVREHLRLYGKLKVDNWDTADETNLDQLLAMNQLTDKADQLAGTLSGGMKRKLCVAMALVGNSPVVLLDEPTAGMDPEARDEIKKVIKAEKNKRTILLTTHYMDEADSLGDEIIIMVKGRNVCNGSPEELKVRYGTGYILTFVIREGHIRSDEFDLEDVRNSVMSVVRKHVHNAEFESSCGLQFAIILPVENRPYFVNLFAELEDQKDALKISSFGLSFNTLEQVFLRVGEQAEDLADHVDGNSATSNASMLFGNQVRVIEGLLFFRQIYGVLSRYAINAYRNKLRTVLPIVLAIVLFSAVAFSQISTNVRQYKNLGLLAQEPLTIPLQFDNNESASADFSYIAGKFPGAVVHTFPPKGQYTEQVLYHAYDSPALGIGAYISPNGTSYVYFNGAAYHAPPLALSFASNAVLQEKADSITAYVEIYSADDSMDTDITGPSISSLFVNILTILCFSFFTSVFVMPLVEDRESRFKHQLLLTRLNRITYWMAVTLWNGLIYIAFCLILTLILFVSGWLQACMSTNFIFWTLYFWCAVPFVYVASFIFQSPIKAFVALLTWNVIAGIVSSISITIILTLGYFELSEWLMNVSSVILPAFALGHGVMEGMQTCLNMGQSSVLRKVMICMGISGCLWWFLLILCENNWERFYHFLSTRIQKNYETIDPIESEDEDVRGERVRMNQTIDGEQALCVRDISKYFGKFPALRKLTFGVRPDDCFGLLGVNGAGKTTTFDILTGRTFASFGSATVAGVDIRKMPSIGYCPQFDALALDLTGRETLALLGALNGFSNVADRVERVLESIQMTDQADKLVIHYSGGQKRRISIGLTLMSRASLIMLDEPTAGIDPKTRRHIWNLISAIRDQNVAILLTSHSMDECEALCSRIGFLNKGSLISIGTSQHLKSRYGNSFLLSFTIENPNMEKLRILDQLVVEEFGAEPTLDSEYMETIHWDIPRKGNSSWSKMFQKAEEIKARFSVVSFGNTDPVIKDFSVTQNSLEQVFLRLTQLGDSMEDNTPRSM